MSVGEACVKTAVGASSTSSTKTFKATADAKAPSTAATAAATHAKGSACATSVSVLGKRNPNDSKDTSTLKRQQDARLEDAKRQLRTDHEDIFSHTLDGNTLAKWQYVSLKIDIFFTKFSYALTADECDQFTRARDRTNLMVQFIFDVAELDARFYESEPKKRVVLQALEAFKWPEGDLKFEDYLASLRDLKKQCEELSSSSD